jgi:hypothetical protein
MRCLVIVKANEDSEAGVLPSTEILTAMGKYNEEVVKAGVMLAGDGLQPSSKGKRVRAGECEEVEVAKKVPVRVDFTIFSSTYR